MYVFFNKVSLLAIFYRKNISFIHNRLFSCNHACYCVNMVSVTSASRYITSASRYHPLYQSRSSMYIRGLIPRNFTELTETVPIEIKDASIDVTRKKYKLVQSIRRTLAEIYQSNVNPDK